jgi:hypothetical protein
MKLRAKNFVVANRRVPPQADYGDVTPDECAVTLAGGRKLVCPAFPSDCTYVRIVSPDGHEEVYWASDEWRDDPEVVMGAIMGALNNQ